MSDMNKIKTKSILKTIKRNQPPLEEAKIFSVPIDISGKHVTIKLPRKVLDYLHLDKDKKQLNILPINNTLQITNGKVLTLIPALDLESLNEQFVDQTI